MRKIVSDKKPINKLSVGKVLKRKTRVKLQTTLTVKSIRNMDPRTDSNDRFFSGVEGNSGSRHG